MRELERIRRSFELGSPLAQGAALYEIERATSLIAALEADNERLRKALEPFAKAPYVGPNAFNRAALSDSDFRAARAALEAKPSAVKPTGPIDDREEAYVKHGLREEDLP